MRILVISNLGLVRHTIEQTMLLDSHSVTTSEGFLQAVDVLRRDHSIDLIITDWSIKGGTAFDVYQSLRQIDRVTDNGSAPEPFFLVTVQPDRGVSG
ncbi:MAG: response regulator, partial [Planctomycetaceae bacterium]|nr:response regulator [Planctomycetaceae bacterium]